MKALIIIPMLALMAAMPGHREQTFKWVVQQGCNLKVAGKTNINKFNCEVREYSKPDTISFYHSEPNSSAVPLSGELSIPVASFDCFNSMMTSDLRKSLKSKQFPHLKIRFLSFKRLPSLKAAEETISGIVQIDMAGASKKYEVAYRIGRDDKQIIHLVGAQQIRFSDFNLEAPKKLGGMVKADDELNVEFYINFKTVFCN
ncbi:MAG: YceI family protein [Candidatus Pseudobacter hemicellulosilyticus]|uniref:YceI family protein n=1 Tax=Candidatus Pseudobacter hemicellulosilyticus TaxID=3121375 RepID=A0AAJ6BGG5_9BACT|nr:MAG: YceI family protein [Pseudobacter sp.]